MNTKLIYLYLLSFAVCLVSSCTSDAPEIIDTAKGVEVSFAASSLSRASVTTSIDHFAIYGDAKSSGDGSSTQPLTLFNKTKVEYKNNAWVYEGVQYWLPKHEHSFVAISPMSVLDTGASPLYQNSQLSFTYTIPITDGTLSSNDDVVDILVATHRRLYKQDESTVKSESNIILKFGHIMSLINLAPAFYDNTMSNDKFISIKKLELMGICSKARFDVLPASRQSNTQTDDMEIKVTGLMDSNLTIEFETPVKIMNDGKNVNLFAANDAVIMLPKAFDAASDAMLVLSYTINDDSEINQVNLPLRGYKWESGKSYIYKFIIEKAGLILDKCEINPWNEVKGDDIEVD